jgi:hypothetical protein
MSHDAPCAGETGLIVPPAAHREDSLCGAFSIDDSRRIVHANGTFLAWLPRP